MSRYNLRILFGLSLLQNMLLSSKFRITDNFIYPNGRKLNITLPLLFVVETIETTSKISIFMNYFFSIYFSVGIFAIFGFNVLHGHDNVLLILTFRRSIQISMLIKGVKCNLFYGIGSIAYAQFLLVLCRVHVSPPCFDLPNS